MHERLRSESKSLLQLLVAGPPTRRSQPDQLKNTTCIAAGERQGQRSPKQRQSSIKDLGPVDSRPLPEETGITPPRG